MASQSGGALPPPPGAESYFDVNNPGQWRGNAAIHVLCLAIATVSVMIRQCARIYITGSRMGIDDYLSMGSYLLTAVFSRLMHNAYLMGLGRHVQDLPPRSLTESLKYSVVASFVYIALSAAIKLMLLFFYRRSFSPQTKRRHLINFGIAFVACLSTTLLLTSVFSCVPVERQWNVTIEGYCFNPDILPYISGISGILTDLYVLLLPISLLRGLGVNLKQEMGLVAIFVLGLFACVASLVRLAMTLALRSSFDVTWDMSRVDIWETVQVTLGIVCASLVTLPALLSRHFSESGKPLSLRLCLFDNTNDDGGKDRYGGPGYYDKAILEPRQVDKPVIVLTDVGGEKIQYLV
ncbi:hypothetical protein GGS23DRAFT_550519 [Durotheca rogersii]|uniref:uncharacterized protein n=1 Tax=Durotheca rogersii TaxID=419775 RepID=UPI0022201B3D|nr:uncharacterized protein GGS23DRAFT_550519 [Durotheca rogersii]KAI5866410.1 hypothetical protein GGS23DRAFT_550519 [Durotheca rogersii]